jgi:hypothetical protein
MVWIGVDIGFAAVLLLPIAIPERPHAGAGIVDVALARVSFASVLFGRYDVTD